MVSFAAMKNKAEITINTDRSKIWARWTLEAASWLICIGLLAASAGVAGMAGLVWLVSGSTTLLAIGLLGGLALGLAGVWHILLRMDQAVQQLKADTVAAE